MAAFQHRDALDVLLLTTQVGGLGVDLSAASVVVFLEHSWNHAVDQQAADRAHRLTQRRHVHVYKLFCPDTVEERVLGCVHAASGLLYAALTRRCRIQALRASVAATVVAGRV